MRNVNMNSIRVLDRAIDIFEAFSLTKTNLTIDELVDATKLPKATAYRLLYTLERRGLIHYDPVSLKYRLGLRLLQYSGLVTAALDVRNEAEDILIDLHASTKQTVLMAVLEGDEMVYVFRRENPDGLKYSSFVGQRRRPPFGVVGQVILAYMPEKDAERVLSTPLPQLTSHTMTDKSQILARLKQVKFTGAAIDVEETTVGVSGVGAPVFDSHGKMLAAVGVIGPSVQLQGDILDSAKQMLLEATTQISTRMGYRVTKSYL